MSVQLELHDIQGTVLRTRPMPYYGAYVIFRIDEPEPARTLIQRLIPHITTAEDWEHPPENAWINVAFTFEGLRRLGLPEEILAGFPSEFREGMAARKDYLGDVGESDPKNWNLPHSGNGFHIGLMIMASTEKLRDEKLAIGHNALSQLPGLTKIATLDVALPATLREHFGFIDGLTRPVIEGAGGKASPGQEEEIKAGEFVLGYVNELGEVASAPGPEAFWRNGTYISIRKIRQKVAAFRKYLAEQADTKEGQELVAAKMMGRWRSGCALALSPLKDNPELVSDQERNNAFSYYSDDLKGSKTPVGCHIRRVNPRDGLKDTFVKPRLHLLLRRGAAYGPTLPEDATTDDGQDRGIVIAFVNANPGRQFEFVQSQWINNGDFISQGTRADPIIGRRDFSDDFVFPAKPVRRHLTGLPDFTVTCGGEHVFVPGLNGLRWLVENCK